MKMKVVARFDWMGLITKNEEYIQTDEWFEAGEGYGMFTRKDGTSFRSPDIFFNEVK